MQSDESEPKDSSSEASEASSTSAKTVESSNCDPHKPDAAPGVVASDVAAILATHDVTQVVSEDVNAPLVTIALDEAALAPAVLLLRLPYLERLLGRHLFVGRQRNTLGAWCGQVVEAAG